MKIKSFQMLPAFERELKRLAKKYPSLQKDFQDFQTFLEIYPTGLWTGDIVRINNLGEEIVIPIYKARSFRCYSIAKNSNNSGIRIIYAYDNVSETIEFVEFIEIYHKWTKETEDRDRIIEQYCGKETLVQPVQHAENLDGL
jgi:mRNA-degrading endonuclease RelE of RelBE toxin-antitoxin system